LVSPADFPEYVAVEVHPLTVEIREAIENPEWLSPCHCESNSAQVAVRLAARGIVSEVVGGLALLPLHPRVNDPERCRPHVWLRVGGRYYDPTYEVTWVPVPSPVSYFLVRDLVLSVDGICKEDRQLLESGSGVNVGLLEKIEASSDALETDYAAVTDSPPAFDVAVLVKHHGGQPPLDEYGCGRWQVREAIRSLDGVAKVEVLLTRSSSVDGQADCPPSVQLRIIGGAEGQYGVEAFVEPVSDYSHWLEARAPLNLTGTTVLLPHGESREPLPVAVSRVVTLDEALHAADFFWLNGGLIDDHAWARD